MPRDYAITATTIVAFWALCAFVHPAVRRALLGGLRCMQCHADLWRIPALFGFSYALFQLAAAALFHLRLGDFTGWLQEFIWQPGPGLPALLAGDMLPTAERTASVFTIFTATFPLSALFAVLLIFNFRGLLVEMTKAFRRRLGRWRGLLVVALLLLTALCAIARPIAFLLLPEVSEHVDIMVILAVNFLSFIFELLLGIFFLTYLMLMAYAWMRGLHFERFRLFHVAMRRTGFVVKWSLPLSLLATLLIVVPLDLSMLLDSGDGLADACVWFSTWIGRPAVTAIALLYCPVQAILVFHNESLRQALRDSSRLLRTRWPEILLFLATAFASFLLLNAISDYVVGRLGAETPAALVVAIATALIEAMLAGWLIAGWVCLYKSLSASRKEIPF